MCAVASQTFFTIYVLDKYIQMLAEILNLIIFCIIPYNSRIVVWDEKKIFSAPNSSIKGPGLFNALIQDNPFFNFFIVYNNNVASVYRAYIMLFANADYLRPF